VKQADVSLLRDWERAARHFASGQYVEARVVLTTILERDPESAQARLAMAQVDIHSGNVRRAFLHASNALLHAPSEAGLLCDIATALLTVGAAARARDSVERAAAIAPPVAVLQHRIALHYQNINEHDSALEWMERARAEGLDDVAARFCLAVQLIFHGRMCEAAAELEACASAVPPLGRAMVQLSHLRRQTAEQNHLESLECQLANAVASSEEFAALEFARYKELEDLGRYEDAWHSLTRANATMRALLKHDTRAEQRTFDALMKCVDAMPMPAVSNDQPTDEPIPIFIVGMPRSGTTLLDRMLGNHSQVRSAGELGTFRRGLELAADRFTGHMLDEAMVAKLSEVDYSELGDWYLANSQWLARGHRFYIDKLPRNWLLAPLIRCAIPQARILHMVRTPMDTVFSNLRSYFGGDYPYCYDEESLGIHYLQYRKVMAHWHAVMPGSILDVSYANLVDDPDSVLHRIFAFCGLAWESGCADLKRNHQPVATLSAIQVRDAVQPVFSERWRHYASHLSGLRARVVPNADLQD
jgi:tetratricopeptide (TPR) repeat protein